MNASTSFASRPLIAIVGAAALQCGPSSSSSPAGANDAAMGVMDASELDAVGDAAPHDGGAEGAGRCVALDSGFPEIAASPASGSVTGPGVDVAICQGGLFAVTQRIPSPPDSGALGLLIDPGFGSPQYDFAAPPGVQWAETRFVGEIGSIAPGTYPSSLSCGDAHFCAYFYPAGAAPDCGDAAVPTSCPSGCAPAALPSGAVRCEPLRPQACYVARTARDCGGNPQSAAGSWTVTLTSVTPYDGADGGPGSYFTVHGTLFANLVGDDAGLGGANLFITF
jgi:hypothetical protein